MNFISNSKLEKYHEINMDIAIFYLKFIYNKVGFKFNDREEIYLRNIEKVLKKYINEDPNIPITFVSGKTVTYIFTKIGVLKFSKANNKKYFYIKEGKSVVDYDEIKILMLAKDGASEGTMLSFNFNKIEHFFKSLENNLSNVDYEHLVRISDYLNKIMIKLSDPDIDDSSINYNLELSNVEDFVSKFWGNNKIKLSEEEESRLGSFTQNENDMEG